MALQTLHFTLGPEAGKLIMKIAQEKLLCEYDPNKALAVITDSLIGIDRELALKILSGEYVITVDTTDDIEYFNVEPRNEKIHADYPLLDIVVWHLRRLHEINDDGTTIFKALDRMIHMIVKGQSTDDGFKMTIPYDIIMRYVLCEDATELRDYADSNIQMHDTTEEISIIMRTSKRYIDTSVKLWSAFNWITKAYPDVTLADNKGIFFLVEEVSKRLKSLTAYDLDMLIRLEDEGSEEIEEYFNAQREIEHKLQCIQPVNIHDNYDAGWISPDGTVYALNGDISNMLHNQLADALEEAGIVTNTEEDYCGNIDGWMGRTGWAKFHNGRITFEGYDNGHMHKPIVPITAEQVKVIYEYGQLCCQGILKLGLTYEPISAARFKMTELTMMNRYFSFS